MTRIYAIAVTLLATALSVFQASALHPREYPDTFLIPSRAVIATGDSSQAHQLVAVLYDTNDLHFSDPAAPRFLFLDREGKVALGIGGYIKGTLQYDMDGAIDDGASFTTYDIPVPMNPAQRNQFYGNANHSTIFLQLVGKSERFGYYSVYAQTQFSGNGMSGYGLRLKQAYLKVGYVTAGLANSTFVDGAAGTPGIDDQGPSGELSRKNVMLRYAPRFSDSFSGAIAVEMPAADYTTNQSTEKINQRVPDIPVYLQYEWGAGAGHVRLSGLLRNLSYRDLASEKNHFRTGWAVQLSGMAKLGYGFKLYYQGAYGQGYGSYINDLGDGGMDLAYSVTTGKMEAPKLCNYELGARYDANSKLYFTGTYSEARTFGQRHLGPETYRCGRYVGVTGFYNIVSDLCIGLEYLWGQRSDYSGQRGHANRVMGMLQYNF
ncbi:MAG: porin [Firmicutes bacterium]|nr:porin [Bacillota bacterium]MCM1401630.1 porin [Bacteroides sp.]MCM1477516.1 porin [Bacteroides sp.]